MLLTVFMMCGLAVILWITVGYSLSFSGNQWGIVGNLNNVLMIHVPIDAITKTGIPIGDYTMFMMMFAIITRAIFCICATTKQRSATRVTWQSAFRSRLNNYRKL